MDGGTEHDLVPDESDEQIDASILADRADATPDGDAILYGHGRDEQTEQRREIDRLRRQVEAKDKQLAIYKEQMKKITASVDQLQQRIQEMQYHASRAEKRLHRQTQYAAASKQQESIADVDDEQNKSIFSRGFFGWLR